MSINCEITVNKKVKTILINNNFSIEKTIAEHKDIRSIFEFGTYQKYVSELLMLPVFQSNGDLSSNEHVYGVLNRENTQHLDQNDFIIIHIQTGTHLFYHEKTKYYSSVVMVDVYESLNPHLVLPFSYLWALSECNYN